MSAKSAAGHSTLTLLIALVIVCTSCGGSSGAGLTQSLSLGDGRAPNPIAMDQALAEIESAAVPAGVDEELWGRLTAELVQELSRGASEILQHPPAGEANRVTDLELIDDGGNMSLQWSYVNVGDYNRDGLVGVSDLTPVGQYFEVADGDPQWDTARYADGNGDGRITVNDITQIGQNFLSQVSGYMVQGSHFAAGPWDSIQQLAFVPPGGTEPVTFNHPLGDASYSSYSVAPADSGGALGIESVPVTAAPPRLTAPLAISPASGFTDTNNELVFTIGLAASVGDPISAELAEVDSDGNQIAVLGELWDDGAIEHGDEFAGDSVLSARVSFNRPAEGSYYFRADITFDDGGVTTIGSNRTMIQLFTAVSDDRFQEIHDQTVWVNEQVEALASTMTVPEACAQVADMLASDPNYLEVVIGNEGYSVNWVTAEGYPCFVLFPPDDDYSGAGASSLSASSLPVSEYVDPDEVIVRATRAGDDNVKPVGNRRVLILDPQNKTNGNVASLFENKAFPKYDVDYFNTPETCTLEAFKTMKDYGVVILVTRGIYLSDQNNADTYCLQTGQLWNDTSKAEYEAEWKQGLIAFGMVVSNVYWGIRPGFITKYCQGMPGSLVFVMAHYSLKDDRLAAPYLAAGAQVYYGLDLMHSDAWPGTLVNEFFTDMLNGENSLEAISPIRTDPQYKNCTLLMKGGGFVGAGNPVSITKGLFDIILLDRNGGAGSSWKGNDSTAHDLNNAGQVVGTAAITTPEGDRIHAFRWDPGEDKLNPTAGATMRDLHTFGDSPPSSRGTVINDLGDTAGYSGDGFPAMWVAYNNEGAPAPMSWVDETHIGFPVDMNNLGSVAGETGIKALGQKRHAMVFLGGEELLDLGLLADGDKGARATVVNDYVLIAGYATNALDKHVGFYFKDDTLVELPRPVGSDESEVTCGRGQFTLYGWTRNSHLEACYWHVLPEGVTHHKLPNSFGVSAVHAASENGNIIGVSALEEGGVPHEVIWRHGRNSVEDLRNLLDSLDPDTSEIIGISFDELVGVNDAGQILVNAEIYFLDTSSEMHGVLLNPRIALQ